MGARDGTMRGRVCLVTGANTGIGKATARELAARGADVIMVARDHAKGERARREVIAGSGNRSVELLVADLASQRQVRELAGQVLDRYDRLDVLVNNAGLFTRERTLTEDGVETQFAVNHLAPFLLTSLLLDRLRASAPARIVTVSSEAHRHARLDWENLQGEARYGGMRAYGNSKLANILFTRELARRLQGSGVTANALHPGVIATNLIFGMSWLTTLIRPFLKTPEQGARTTVFLATSREVEGVSGAYFKDERQVKPSQRAMDHGSARRLWEISERLTGLEAGG